MKFVMSLFFSSFSAIFLWLEKFIEFYLLTFGIIYTQVTRTHALDHTTNAPEYKYKDKT
jgi:hypothetical protein